MVSVDNGTWSIGEAAKFLGVCKTTMRKLSVQTHEVPFARVGRQLKFQPAQLQQWLDAQTQVTVGKADRV